jgi:hypothetical protein
LSTDIATTETEPGGDPGPGARAPGEDEEAERWAGLERRVAQSVGHSAPPLAWVTMAVMAALAGLTVHRVIPHPLAAVIVVAVLMVVMLAGQVEAQRIRASAEPAPDVAELEEYAAWLPRRVPAVPAQTLAAADRYLGQLAGGRWRSAHLLIARTGRLDIVARHHRAGDRLELVLEDHLAEGPPGAAAAALAHEARHSGMLAAAAQSLARLLCQPVPLLVAVWALPWPATLTPGAAEMAVAAVAGLRVVATLIFWAVEIACDLGAARDQGAAAARAVLDVIAAADAQARRSYARRAIVRFVNWGAPPPHPPLWLRRAAVHLRPARPGGGSA